MTRYRPPRDCPVCSDRLQITQLGCPRCGTGLSGAFNSCEFCGLDDAERELLRVFLVSRGNMKELERHLRVSYPTARARLDDLLRTLGLIGSTSGVSATGTGAASRPGEQEHDARLATLHAVAAGELEVAAARQALTEADPDPDS